MIISVYVNDEEVNVLPGMTVKHAVVSAGFFEEIEASKKIFDEQGKEVGLDGAATEGMKLYVR